LCAGFRAKRENLRTEMVIVPLYHRLKTPTGYVVPFPRVTGKTLAV